MSEKRKDSKGRILRNGEVQRSDGKYMFRYTDVTGKRQTVYSWKLVATDKVPDGKRCKVSLRELEKQIVRDLDDNIRTADATNTVVDDLFKSFMEIRIDLKETTRCNYINLYDYYIRDELGYRTLKTVKYSDIQKLYMYLIQEKGFKLSTIESIHSIIYQMFDAAVMDNIIRVNPSTNVLKNVRKIFKEDRTKKHALTEEEQVRFIDYVYNSKTYKRWGPLFTVLLGTGMRIGEALGLRWRDCDFDKNVITVDHILLYKVCEASGKYEYRVTSPKTIAGKRLIPMLGDVKRTLLTLQEEQKRVFQNHKPFTVDGYTGFIFLNSNGKVFTNGAVHGAIQNIITLYNRDEYFLAKEEERDPVYLPKFSAHNLRHTFCTRYCEYEKDLKTIQDVMGHRNITTTMNVYNETTESRKQVSFEHLEGKFRVL